MTPGTHRAIKRSETWFRRFATVAVALEPGAGVCLLSGMARMSPSLFSAVNVVGTAARVLAIRLCVLYAATGFGFDVTTVTSFIDRFRSQLTIATAVVSVATAVPLALGVIRAAGRSGGGGGGGSRTYKYPYLPEQKRINNRSSSTRTRTRTSK